MANCSSQKAAQIRYSMEDIERLIKLALTNNINLEVGDVKITQLPLKRELIPQVSDEPIKIESEQLTEEQLLFHSSEE